MSNTELTLDQIPKLSKTKATKALAAAVREHQGVPRAVYKPQGCPLWWKPNFSVTLADGKDVITSRFTNPTLISLPSLKAALHLFIESKLGGEQEEDAGEQQQVEHHDDQVFSDVAEQKANSPRVEKKNAEAEKVESKAAKMSKNTVSKRRKIEVEADDDKKEATTRLRGKNKRRKVEVRKAESVKETEDDSAVEVESNEADEEGPVFDVNVSSPANSVINSQYTKRIEYINRLKVKRADMKAQAQRMIAAKEARRAKTEHDMRQSLETRLLLLNTRYEQCLAQLPRALLQVRVRDIVDRYGMSKETWLHKNVERAVERALRDNMLQDSRLRKVGKKAKTKAKPDVSTRVLRSSSCRENEPQNDDDVNDDLPLKTPPARTPAARKRREDIQKTISKTVRRVRLEQEQEHELNRQDDDYETPSRFSPSGMQDRTEHDRQPMKSKPKGNTIGGQGLRNEDRELGSVIAALGFDVDFDDGDEVKGALTKTLKRSKNPLRLIEDVEKWCRTLRRQYEEQDDEHI